LNAARVALYRWPTVFIHPMLKNLSIQSKTTLMLLAVSISSVLVIAYVGYRSGKTALTRGIFNQLTGLRAAKSNEIQSYENNLRAQVRSMSQDPTIIQAMREFKTAYQNLSTATIQPEQRQTILTYYRDQFIPQLPLNLDGDPAAATYVPRSAVGQYLQYHYTLPSSDLSEKVNIDDPGDGSDYSTWHRQFHPYFRHYIQEFKQGDIFLIDPETGSVVYTVNKHADFATNLQRGPFAQSLLAQVFDDVLKRAAPGYLAIADFEPYQPSYNHPEAMMATPIFDEGDMIGILAFQIPVDEIDRVMTYEGKWQAVGLGETGETYLVGPDYLMRSNSRFLKEDPKAYFQALTNQGVAVEKIDRIQRIQTSILEQEVRTAAVERSLNGNPGTAIIEDYRGASVLSSFTRLQLLNTNWVVVAEIDTHEAFAPIRTFEKWVLISTALLVVVMTLIAMVLSHFFVRPIRLLTHGFQQLSQGKTDVTIQINSRDELQDLATSFNEMVVSLNQTTQRFREKCQENENLLLSILPGPVAQRLKQGEEQIADSFSNVTVLFADLVGFSDLAAQVSADELVALLNDLVRAFDEAAERHGVEKVKTIGSGYMAVSGLSVPRLDHTKRVIDFAIEMIRIVQRFNQTHQTQLKTSIGINAGPVTAGIVGRSKFIYDLWGDTVNLAHCMQRDGQGDTVQVTEPVYSQLKDFYDFDPNGPINPTGKEEQGTWLIHV